MYNLLRLAQINEAYLGHHTSPCDYVGFTFGASLPFKIDDRLQQAI